MLEHKFVGILSGEDKMKKALTSLTEEVAERIGGRGDTEDVKSLINAKLDYNGFYGVGKKGAL